MKKIEFVAGNHEWSIVVDGEIIHTFDDFSDDLQGDNITAEQIADLVDDLIYSWQQSFENDLGSLDDPPTVTPIWETDGFELKLVMFTALCERYNVSFDGNKINHYNNAKLYVQNRMTNRRCNRCKKPVLLSDVDGYQYQCLEHDEDLCTFETFESDEPPTKEERQELISYAMSMQE